MNLKRFQKLLHDSIRKEKEENGLDVRGYTVARVNLDRPTEADVLIEFDHTDKLVLIYD